MQERATMIATGDAADPRRAPTRRFRARGTMMIALVSWFAGLGERFAAMWRRRAVKV